MEDLMMTKKIAVVTGGGRGIGREITLNLLAEGIFVIVVQRSPLDEELESYSTIKWIPADLTDLNTLQPIYDYIADSYGRLDIIVNNAGVMSNATLEALELEEWQKTLMVNTTFPLFMVKKLLPLLRKSDAGSIINIGSIEGISANPEHTAYCTSKAAIHGMTRSLAVDLGQYGIRCNAIAPGWIDTGLNDDMAAQFPSQQEFNHALNRLHPVGRTGKPKDIAQLVVFLASEKSSFISGQIYIIDGGRTAMLPLPTA